MKAIDEKVLNERIIPQIPVGRLGEPEEIARIVVFLLEMTPASSPVYDQREWRSVLRLIHGTVVPVRPACARAFPFTVAPQ